MRYTYTVSIANVKFECADVQGVVEAVSGHTDFPMLTEAMVFNHLTRPHRANKRLFAVDRIHIERTRLPTKAELTMMAQAQVGTPHPGYSAA